jgi:HEAT repeat protein
LRALARLPATHEEDALVDKSIRVCLGDLDSGIVLNAIISSRERHMDVAVPDLEKLLQDSTRPDFVRIHAAWALAGIRNEASAGALVRALDLQDNFIAANVAKYMAAEGMQIPRDILRLLRVRVSGDTHLTRMVALASQRIGVSQ